MVVVLSMLCVVWHVLIEFDLRAEGSCVSPVRMERSGVSEEAIPDAKVVQAGEWCRVGGGSVAAVLRLAQVRAPLQE